MVPRAIAGVPVKHYTAQQLSRVLGEHAAGHLQRLGGEFWVDRKLSGAAVRCCANQAAYNEPSCYTAYVRNRRGGSAFDLGYAAIMTPEQLLALLEPEDDDAA